MGLDALPAGTLSSQPSSPPSYAPSRAFVVRVEQQQATLLLRLSGELDSASVGRVESALQRISPSIRRIVFDLQDLTFLDSRGLTTILKTNERARDEEFDVVVVRPRGLANRVFTLTGAGDKLTLIDRPPHHHCFRPLDSGAPSSAERSE